MSGQQGSTGQEWPSEMITLEVTNCCGGWWLIHPPFKYLGEDGGSRKVFF
jgi:hypothetical protein